MNESRETTDLARHVAQIIDRLTPLRMSAKRAVLVAISGIDCSGKSSTAAALADAVHARGWRTSLVSVDEFLFPRAERYSNPDRVHGYLEETFDFATLFEGLLIPARRAERLSVTLPGLDWERDIPVTRTYEVDAGTLLIVEGVFLLRPELRGVFDLRIWLELGFEEGLRRALSRPRDLAYYGSADVIRERYLQRFYPAQKIHIDRDMPARHAELVLTADDRLTEEETAMQCK